LINTNQISISAVIPCFNHWNSINKAIKSILLQSVEVFEILIIDDCSEVPCPHQKLKEHPKIKIIRLDHNLGRGFCRDLAFKKTSGEFVLNLDATNFIEKNFIEKALPHFENPIISAVSGALFSETKIKSVDRWRSRHLFREESLKNNLAEPCSMLITYGTIFRREAINEVGGFNSKLRFKEDQEMGERLAKKGYQIIGDPKLKVYASVSNSITEVLERYSRWYMDTDEKPSLKSYLHNLKASFRPMMEMDIKDGDWKSALISMLAPHFQFFYSIKTYMDRGNT